MTLLYFFIALALYIVAGYLVIINEASRPIARLLKFSWFLVAALIVGWTICRLDYFFGINLVPRSGAMSILRWPSLLAAMIICVLTIIGHLILYLARLDETDAEYTEKFPEKKFPRVRALWAAFNAWLNRPLSEEEKKYWQDSMNNPYQNPYSGYSGFNNYLGF